MDIHRLNNDKFFKNMDVYYLNEDGPWETLLEEQLSDTKDKGSPPAPLLTFILEKPVKVQFLKFDLISYWGPYGGGLQYFAPIPA